MKNIPILYAFLVPFIVLTAVFVGLISYISFSNSREAVNDVADRLRKEISTRIREHLDNFLQLPHNVTESVRETLSSGLINPDDPEKLMKYFKARVMAYPSISSIYFGNTRGGLVDSGREGPNGACYFILTDSFTRGPLKKYAVDDQGNRAEVLFRLPEFDATLREWYTHAAEKGGAAWSPIYILSTGQDLAVAASRPVLNENGTLIGVVSVDIFLTQLSDFLKHLSIGKTGLAFIIERSGLLAASSTDEALYAENPDTKKKIRLNAADSRNPVIRHAMETWRRNKDGTENDSIDERLSFEIDGQGHYLQVASLQDDYGLDWLSLVVIPESDFMSRIKAGNRTAAFLIVASLILALSAGFFAARRITGPVLRLNAAARNLAGGEKIQPIRKGTWLKELNELIQSFNQMSWTLYQTMGELRQEIDERKQAEGALQKSEEKYRHLLEASNTDIFALNADGAFLFINSTAARHIGCQTEDFTGLTIWDVFPREIADRHIAGVREIIRSGKGKEMESETVLLGQRRWYRTNGQPLKDEKGSVYGAMFIGQDITEGWQAKKALLESNDKIRMALREKQVLLKEIHHRVKNNLQIISSLISLQAQKAKNRQVKDVFAEAQSRVRAISLVHETLYRCENLSEINLEVYLKDLVMEISQLFRLPSGQIDITVHTDDIRVAMEEAVPCGLIVNELLTNSFKHAFLSGEKGRIEIRVEQKADQQIVMVVSDNGIGLPEGVDPSTSKTLGLPLVVELVEDQLEGSWRIEREKGVCWTIRWPLT